MPAIQSIARGTVIFLVFAMPIARGGLLGWSVAGMHILTLIAWFLLLESALLTGGSRFTHTRLDTSLLAALALGALATLFSANRVTSFWAFLLFANYLAVFHLVVQCFPSRRQRQSLVHALLGMGVLVALLGFARMSGIGEGSWLFSGHGGNLLQSTYTNRNHAAGLFGMLLPLALCMVFTKDSPGGRVLMGGVVLVLAAALVCTFSRGGLLAASLGLGHAGAWALIRRRHSRKTAVLAMSGSLLGVFLILAAAGVFFGKTPARAMYLGKEESLKARLTAWRGVLSMVADNPLLGSGPGTFSFAYMAYQPPGIAKTFHRAHNDYLELVCDAGLFVLPLIGWMAWMVVREGARRQKSVSRFTRNSVLGALSGMAALAFHGLGDFNLRIPANALVFTLLAALVAAPRPRSGQSRPGLTGAGR
jgi:O-antigen ligase